ncbi:MAG TPA: peptide chain release factor N(5)-glutamine methyltransferase [Candidatus Cybelea sp.]
MTTIAAALSDATARLRARESARADALLLLEYALGRTRAWIAAYGETALSPESEAEFRALCERRDTGAPAAYLVRSAGFYGREFVVNESVLIPRPETEHLVDEAIAFVGEAPAAALDVGTGSGAIACTIAARTSARVDATDISIPALDVARANAARLEVADRCRFHHGDLAEPVKHSSFDVVLANLPYIPTPDVPQRPDPIAFEPRVALDGGADGLVCYRRLLAELPAMLNARALVLLEGAPPTIGGLSELARAALPGFAISVHRDYAGLDRYVRAERLTD